MQRLAGEPLTLEEQKWVGGQPGKSRGVLRVGGGGLAILQCSGERSVQCWAPTKQGRGRSEVLQPAPPLLRMFLRICVHARGGLGEGTNRRFRKQESHMLLGKEAGVGVGKHRKSALQAASASRGTGSQARAPAALASLWPLPVPALPLPPGVGGWHRRQAHRRLPPGRDTAGGRGRGRPPAQTLSVLPATPASGWTGSVGPRAWP